MSDEGNGSEHYLTPYLRRALPALGLDSETYGPYVTGLFPHDADDQSPNVDRDSNDEAMDEILELLQASSETHSEDAEAFRSLREDLGRLRSEHRIEYVRRKEEERERQRKRDEDRRRDEIEEARRSEAERLERKQKKNEEEAEDRLSKLALVEKFGYDESEMYDEKGNLVVEHPGGDGSGGGGKGGDDEAEGGGGGNVNRVDDSKAMKEKGRELRKQHETSKKAAREATARAKLEKSQAKEERRKRATKGERRR